MNAIERYFSTKQEDVYFNQLKLKFFIRICLYSIPMLLMFLAVEIFVQNDNFIISFWSKAFSIVFIVMTLFVLKYKGIKFAGNLFSIGLLVLLLIFVNIVPKDVSPIHKFIQGFYSVYAYVVMSMLFASRPVILINTGLILLTTTHVFLRTINLFPDDINLYTSSYINHTFILLAITLIVFFANKFTELAIGKGNEEIEQRKMQNMELIATEEEIRASNEELVATTDALVEANDSLLESKDKAEESDRLKTEFLNNMSHEVRTPMNGIIGFSQLLEIPDLEESSRKHYSEIIRHSSEQLLSIIDNIIEISKLGTKQVKVFEAEINLNKFLSELLEVFELKAKEKDILLALDCEFDFDKSLIIIDEIKLYKILSNLLENALKFTDKGSVEFGYSVILDDESNDNPDNKIRFFIKDTGIGVDPEKQETIFNKFSQAEPELSRQYGGLGLGLSIAKQNTELLNGEIKLDSIQGEGTTFFVILPLKKA